MALYTASGTPISNAYDINGEPITKAYDINEVEIPLDIDVEPLTWNMSDNYKGQILDVLDHISEYKENHSNTYALCQFNDVHLQFDGNEPNFIDYNDGYKIIDRMLFLGDMTDASNGTQYANAVAYMEGASASRRIVAMGNHEYRSYSSDNGNPETLYKAVINVGCTYYTDKALIYYHDDLVKNVRIIVLNYFYLTRIYTDVGHRLDLDQAKWLAGVMESAGDKDIIIVAHSMINPFYVPFIDNTVSSSATLQNNDVLIDIINAYIDRGTYSIAVDGTSYSFNYSAVTGDFIMYTTGHYHAFGHSNDDGFNMFTCPSLLNAYPLNTASKKGFTFYLIDRTLKTIKAFVCSTDLTEYASFDYIY